ncbi:hypothetical protein T492DRAFT_915769 [Pavlovales sp. CCMP2436]|nr:hypothetical protein T492DRAFT_915769 [Pavlovales sp. CCMP2436]
MGGWLPLGKGATKLIRAVKQLIVFRVLVALATRLRRGKLDLRRHSLPMLGLSYVPQRAKGVPVPPRAPPLRRGSSAAARSHWFQLSPIPEAEPMAIVLSS